MAYQISRVRSLIIETHPEFNRIPIKVIDEYVAEAARAVYLINIEMLRDYYTKVATVTSAGSFGSTTRNGYSVSGTKYTLPNDYLTGVRDSLISVSVNGKPAQIVSYNYLIRNINNPHRQTVQDAMASTLSNVLYVFPTLAPATCEIAYIRVLDTTTTIDLPDEYVEQVVNHTIKLLEENILPDPQVTSRNIALSTQATQAAGQSNIIHSEGANDLPRTTK